MKKIKYTDKELTTIAITRDSKRRIEIIASKYHINLLGENPTAERPNVPETIEMLTKEVLEEK